MRVYFGPNFRVTQNVFGNSHALHWHNFWTYPMIIEFEQLMLIFCSDETDSRNLSVYPKNSGRWQVILVTHLFVRNRTAYKIEEHTNAFQTVKWRKIITSMIILSPFDTNRTGQELLFEISPFRFPNLAEAAVFLPPPHPTSTTPRLHLSPLMTVYRRVVVIPASNCLLVVSDSCLSA